METIRRVSSLYERVAKLAVAGCGLIVIEIICAFVMLLCTDDNYRRNAFVIMSIACLAGLVLLVLFAFLVLMPARRKKNADLMFVNYGRDEGGMLPDWSLSDRLVRGWYRDSLVQIEQRDRYSDRSKYIALQQQINPHFLYNTLDSIRSDLIICGELEIADTVEALSKYFSYATTSLDRLSTLDEELNNVRTYFKIQEYRFEDRLKLRIELDEEINSHEIRLPRLCIQPLVENAVNHGLRDKPGQGDILIRVCMDSGCTVIDIMDNGVGICPDKLAELNSLLRDNMIQSTENTNVRRGIALENVNTRLKLLYGEGNGLQIFSVRGRGTDVRIRIPHEEELEVHAERIAAY